MIDKAREHWNKVKMGWIGSILYVIFGFILAIALNWFLGYALNTDTPIVAVFSESMEPVMYKGDMVVVAGFPEYKVGDIVVFDVPVRRYPIIHRIYEITNSTIKTKGDNNPGPDPWTISKEDIHGKSLVRLPLIGWIKIIFTEFTSVG
ncbi:MAG TPA: signal peptidase I [archaeon]|nr:signal peptidase I [archaeon]